MRQATNPAPATSIATLYPAIYIDDNGPCKDCGADSILKASIRMSCVALKNAINTIAIAINFKLSCGFEKDAKIIEKKIKICVTNNQLFLCPIFFNNGISNLSTIGLHKNLKE